MHLEQQVQRERRTLAALREDLVAEKVTSVVVWLVGGISKRLNDLTGGYIDNYLNENDLQLF